MAIMIKLIHARSLGSLEFDINKFFAEEAAKDSQIFCDVVGVTFGDDEYIAAIQINAPHKRSLGGEEESNSV